MTEELTIRTPGARVTNGGSRTGTVKEDASGGRCGVENCPNDRRGGCISVVWDGAKHADRWGLNSSGDTLTLID